ncbi:MAG: transglutaminase family protein [Sumerlaeia bacterium]
MTIRVALTHRTTYRYDRPVSLSPHIVRLRPAPHCRTPILSHSLRLKPEKHFINWQQDPQSNFLARVVFPEKTRILELLVDVVADMTVINPFDFFLEDHAQHFPFRYEEWLADELRPFLRTLDLTPKFKKFVAEIPREKMVTVDWLVALNQVIQSRVKYTIRLEPGVQSPEETLTKGSGSCRDSAWLMVQALRQVGLASRFVSGYLIQLMPDVKPLEGPEGPPADFTDLHAWCEVYLPGAGWVGLDPTSGLFAGEGHIPLAATPDPQSASPISGAVDDCETEFEFHMEVRRILEDPRVTKPYTEEEWGHIVRLGDQVEEELKAGDVRLTMGGEPTFVSIDDMEGDEWNTAAMGPNKRRLSEELFWRMRDEFAPGGLMHFGQGKWYPGESLPRWALTCFWRPDGEPVWRDSSLIARHVSPHGATQEDAGAFCEEVAERLGVGAARALPAYEDAWHYLWKERRLPDNVDPFDSKLDNEEDRARIARVFEEGINRVSGYVLPIGRGIFGYGMEWVSSAWHFRQGRLVLIPGDSPVGYRLPLGSLPWTAPGDTFPLTPLDPTIPRDALPPAEQFAQQASIRPDGQALKRGAKIEQKIPERPKRGQSYSSVVRTAMCVQAREGVLCVFMPPVRRLEDYLELIAVVEATAKNQKLPVRVEGYMPPEDPRLLNFKITPDPGVIEVNIHPSADWKELVEKTTVLYEHARQSRLGTEKFMLDGRHTGTGGGNHIVMGGATPTDSPFLRRPDLLRSLIAYWVNHPSLSYLFSGTFIGPTSQAPRVDEARNDAIYELEIAFRQIPDPDGQPIPPWLIDRILRHLLVDVTGNTHRAEFCIDKLYSPDGSSGRLGLVEFRAFEMPPHSRMCITQALLLRALIAWFWKRPYTRPPIRWGTDLHDRFLLPYFLAEDFRDVMFDLNNGGYGIKEEWFAPHFEFRFPVFGRVSQIGIELEVRQAIEPWLVLGEEVMASGTARYVDSSVERIQATVRGLLDPRRYTVTCNGRAMPMRPTGVTGEFVSGVRYRAWQPPSCLHPTIPVHSPLVFDIVDTWNGRSLGGCKYHVVHPGGRSYDAFPVNAFEAEARRTNRFAAFGHTPGTFHVIPFESNREFPCTLDLRR